ncbi:hypothetical protein SADUNF_Sadunf15G0063200 [Salix dunnii]|uniref:Uncharacterized protein n=1 Tax=Salix dunnii TaxID=1413687 RepID=A0A835MNS6_9ROSI|nr:hypothetical protein SADUNF_Sadunf15G0063200 [Salix dunnii]
MMKTIIIFLTSYKTQLGKGSESHFNSSLFVGSGTKITYDRFLSSIRSKEQEERRKQILVGILYTKSMLLASSEKPSFLLSLISPIFLGLEWVLLLPFSLDGRKSLACNGTCYAINLSFSKEFGILINVLFTGFAALIESNAEGIGGSGFVDVYGRIYTYVKQQISCATSPNDVSTIRDALEVSAEMCKRDANNVTNYIQRHLISLSLGGTKNGRRII